MKITSRKGQLELPWVPWILLIIFLFVVGIVLLVYLKVSYSVYTDTGHIESYNLHTLLNSNECTPNTKLPFKDVLAIGIAQKADSVKEISIKYGGDEDKSSIEDCFSIFEDVLYLPEYFYFYVESDVCPEIVSHRCLQYASFHIPTGATIDYNVVLTEPIALSDGEIGTAVLKISTNR